MQEPSLSAGEEKEEIPERDEITGYVQRSKMCIRDSIYPEVEIIQAEASAISQAYQKRCV